MRRIWRKGPLATAFAGSMLAHALLVGLLWHSRAAAVAPSDPDIELVTVDLADLPRADPVKVLEQPPVVPPPPPAVEPPPKAKPTPKPAPKPAPPPKPAPEPPPPADPDPDPDPIVATNTLTEPTSPTATTPAPEPAPEPAAPVTKSDVAKGFAAFGAVPSVDGLLDADPPPGITTDFNAPMPGEPTVTVLLRLDRLRGTMWAERTEAILAPLPDYRTIVGDDNKGSMYDMFDTLIMSSPRPQDVTATLVIGKVRADAEQQVMTLLDPDGKVAWTETEHGKRGVRPRAARPRKDDPRVLLVPSPERMLLTRPEYLDDETDWLAAIDALEAASGQESGPFAVVTARGFPKALRLPMIGRLPAPERVTASLTNAGRGFLVQGVLTFATVQDAERFATVIAGAQESAAESFAAKRLLEGFGAFNAAKGLRLQQTGENVTFATSVSILDARALMTMGAEWTATYYESKSKPVQESPPKPSP